MMRGFVLLLVLLSAALLGVGSALWAAGLVGGRGLILADIDVEGWQSDWSIGSEAAGPYTRARVARHGLLALTKEEAVYFTKSVDSQGRALSENCTYVVSGGHQPAEWWSITLYDSDSRLPMNRDGALSIDRTTLGDGEWRATVAPVRPAGDEDWLSSRNAGQFDLMIRLYRPTASLIESPETELNVVSIERQSCEGGGDG